jgi:hypothetical protein
VRGLCGRWYQAISLGELRSRCSLPPGFTPRLRIRVTAAPSSAAASIVPSGFEEVTVFSGLTNPTVVRSAADGRVFVAE